ncbi:MAG: GntR family transcriptional regulator [Bacteroidota bacterium]
MARKQTPQYLKIDFHSANPKYLQLANSIINGINEGVLKPGDLLLSINEISNEFDISRDTAEKAYNYLKKAGVIGSVRGKGYFVKTRDLDLPVKICLFFNKLSAHKKIMYDAFAEALGKKATIDFYIYNNDLSLFKDLLNTKKDDYDYYVIIPHFLEGGENAHVLINTIPKEKLVLMDKLLPGVTGTYAAVYENFGRNIYEALELANTHLEKYHTLKIIFPAYTYYPKEIIEGFKRFCHQYAYNFLIVHDIKSEPINAGETFINLMEDDLVILIERILAQNLEVGKDIGVISYNETPLKKIILNGITTISSDFEVMGRKTAEAILDRSTEHFEVPFHLTLRASL